MTVFISGKITGNPNYRQEFAAKAKELSEFGYTPYDPCIIGDRLKEELGREPTYEEYMQRDFKVLQDVDAISFLDNWQESAGAKREYDFAVKHNKKIISVRMFDRRRHSDVPFKPFKR